MKIGLGADPEVFLKKGNTFISGHDIVPGTKKEPYKLKNSCIQADGLALEFNVTPSYSAEEFSDNVKAALEDCRSIVDKSVDFAFVPTAQFDPVYFEKLPKAPKDLGCDPDFSVVNDALNVINNGAFSTPFRTTSGHLHISWTKDKDIKDPEHVDDAKTVAAAVYSWFETIRHMWDLDMQRISLYGGGNAIRVKPYGVEFRTPSNVWLRYPSIYPFLYKAIQETVDILEEGDEEMLRGIFARSACTNRAHVPYGNPMNILSPRGVIYSNFAFKRVYSHFNQDKFVDDKLKYTEIYRGF